MSFMDLGVSRTHRIIGCRNPHSNLETGLEVAGLIFGSIEITASHETSGAPQAFRCLILKHNKDVRRKEPSAVLGPWPVLITKIGWREMTIRRTMFINSDGHLVFQ